MSVALMSWLATTSVPFSRRLPAPGGLTTRTPLNAWPSTGSEKPKSTALSVRGVSSRIVSVAFVPAGASLTELTVMLALAVALE